MANTLHAHGRSVRDDFNRFAFSITPEGGQGTDIRATEVDLAPAINATSEARSTDRWLRVIGFDMAQVTHPENRSRCAPDEAAPSLAKTGRAHVAFVVPSAGANEKARESPVARTLDSNGAYGHAAGGTLDVVPSGVRRLTPRECERLQGFPDDWTLVAAEERSSVPTRKAFGLPGGGSSDSQRYKAIGNSVAVPVIRWIGERLR